MPFRGQDDVATGTKVLERFADCFEDNRNQTLIEHTKLELMSQRIFGIALGYDDSSTDTATVTATCLFTFSAATTFCAPD